MLKGRIVLDHRIVRPAQLASFGVEREQPLMLRTKEKLVAHFNWRDLERGFQRIVLVREVACPKSPGDSQILCVGRRDLSERRIALAKFGAPVSSPVLGRLAGRLLRNGSRSNSRYRAIGLVVFGRETHAQNDYCRENSAPKRK